MRCFSWSNVLSLFVLSLFGCKSSPVEPVKPLSLQPVDASGLKQLYRASPGKIVIVNYWATWCDPCVEEFPELMRVGRSLRPRGVELRFISLDFAEEPEPVVQFLKAQGVSGPSFIREGKDDPFIRAAGADWSGTLPATYVLDRNGAIRNFWEGRITEAVLRTAVESLLEEGG